MKRILVTVFLSLALVPLLGAEEQPKKQAKGKARTEHAATKVNRNQGAVHTSGKVQGKRHMNASNKPVPSNAGATGHVNRKQFNHAQRNVVKQNDQFNRVGNQNVVVGHGGTRNVVANTGGNRRFAYVGSRNYASYGAARQWNWHQRHDRGWWVSSGFPLVLYGGGYWYWNNGWWYPAYGYDPYYSRYVYDGPIYGYGNVAPGDVTAEVQRALANQGYYAGPTDGIIGPMTRRAIRRFQIDHGLAVTTAIDQATLQSLGLA